MGTPGHADCDTLQPLVVMHDAYRALQTNGSRHSTAVAANQLLKYIPVHSAHTFKNAFHGMQIDVELVRLEKVMLDAFFLGRDALAGKASQGSLGHVHKQNAEWLTSMISRTGCFTDQSAAQAEPGAGAKGSTPTALRSIEPSNGTKRSGQQASILIGLFLSILSALLGYTIYQSRIFRIRRVQRLPRHAVAFSARASFDAMISPIVVLDISKGGAKIECDHPPMAKAIITLYLVCGSVPATIVWSTAFYAGVMFETDLTDEALQSILEDEGVKTRSLLSNVF